jgi:hypothetical protein
MSLLEQTLVVVTPVLGLLISWAGLSIARWLHAHVRNEYFKTALVRLNEVVNTVVTGLYQQVTVGLKAASKDGKLTSEEARAIKTDAVVSVLEQLGKSGLRDLEHVLQKDVVEDFVESKIEAVVHELKRESPHA